MKGFAVAVLSLMVAALPVSAQQVERRDALDWLAAEPMTLLDWGMVKLRGDLDGAADYVVRQTRATLARTGVFYRQPDRRVVLYASFIDVGVNRTGPVCKEMFGRLTGAIIHGSPQGSGASWYLESIFSHEAMRGGRPADLGEQMADRVLLQVTIGPAPEDAFTDGRRMVCTGRLDATPENIALRAEG